MEKKAIRKSQEDYLEAILITINRDGACRVTDIAQQMGVSKASTSVAIKKLEEEHYVVRDDWRILLTDTGRAIAEHIYDKHSCLQTWFIKLGVDPKIAEEDACMIEHVISDDTYNKIKEYIRSL